MSVAQIAFQACSFNHSDLTVRLREAMSDTPATLIYGPRQSGKTTLARTVGEPRFDADGLRFGVLICYDSTFPDLAAGLASCRARVLFVPTNNALPESKASVEIVAEARACDAAIATENRCWVVRADVAGVASGLRSHGSSAITSTTGTVVSPARADAEDLLVVEIERNSLARDETDRAPLRR